MPSTSATAISIPDLRAAIDGRVITPDDSEVIAGLDLDALTPQTITDRERLETEIAETRRHRERPGGAASSRIGVGHVRRVGGQAVAEKLGIDLGAASLGMFELLEHDHRARLAHHESVALRIEGP